MPPKIWKALVNCGVLYVKTTVVSSDAVADTSAVLAFPLKLKVYATSFAVKVLPSFQVTPDFSLMVRTVPSALNS